MLRPKETKGMVNKGILKNKISHATFNRVDNGKIGELKLKYC